MRSYLKIPYTERFLVKKQYPRVDNFDLWGKRISNKGGGKETVWIKVLSYCFKKKKKKAMSWDKKLDADKLSVLWPMNMFKLKPLW